MDPIRFDAVLRLLSASPSRRSAVRLLAGLVLGDVLGFLLGQPVAEAHNALKKCKKLNGNKKKQCLKKAKAHNATHRTPCIGRCALTKPCGPDGCGGTCGTCAANEACQSATCVCVPNCPGKNCGEDGCGGSCGACKPEDGGSCQDGVCICTQEICRGVCVAACSLAQERNPVTCGCCTANGHVCDPVPAPNRCCSGQCLFTSDAYRCYPRLSDEPCDFDAQCLSDDCRDSGPQIGTCV
jgi:hypothetical protein